MKKILIINGPNLNMLGIRKRELYGNENLEDINNFIKSQVHDAELTFFQSNSEDEIIDQIHAAMKLYDGAVINPGAFTHYSYAIADAIEAVDIPVVEVHITNIHAREEHRRKSVTAPYCAGQISGLGKYGYILAINWLLILNTN